MSAFADFYSVASGDVVERTAPGEDIAFSEDGPAHGGDITRASDNAFTLARPGIYMVQFALSVCGSARVVLTLNDNELPATVFGRNSNMSQLSGVALITVDTENSVLTVRGLPESSGALYLEATPEGAENVTSHLVITRLQ